MKKAKKCTDPVLIVNNQTYCRKRLAILQIVGLKVAGSDTSFNDRLFRTCWGLARYCDHWMIVLVVKLIREKTVALTDTYQKPT